MPAPGVELGMVGQAQIDVVIARAHSQQKPNLLLATVMAANLALDEVVWHFIAQPVAGAADNFDVFLSESDFLFKFAKHGLFRCFAIFDTALRKLP